MKKIFIHFNTEDGCALHRLLLPYKQVEKLTDTFQFSFGYSKPEMTVDERIQEIAQFDVLIFHRILPENMLYNIKQANPNLIVICDMDDSPRLNDQHVLFKDYKENNITPRIYDCVRQADYVTCTTEILAKELRPFNNNVVIFPNALLKEEQFEPKPTPSNRIRFGLMGGATHIKDYELLEGVVQRLKPDVLSKIQFVLCGFDNSYYKLKSHDGQIHYELARPEDNPWVKIEKLLTDDYRTVTPKTKEILMQYNEALETDRNEPYRRIWLKSVYDYATAYNEIDVLLVPLLENSFNACKSELKLIEASNFNKAAIVSDVYPYKICGINIIEKGGAINPDGNCIMVNNRSKDGWVKAIEKMATNESLRRLSAYNLSKLTQSGMYNLHENALKRIEFLSNIAK